MNLIISPYHLFQYNSYRDIADFCKNEKNSYDLLISAYTNEDIVQTTYQKINATEKIWLIFPEYTIDVSSIDGEKFITDKIDENTKEADYILEMYKMYIAPDTKKRICIDSTGFNKPYLIFLILLLKEKGLKTVDILYTEPQSYPDGSKTKFSEDTISPRDIVAFNEYFSGRGENDLFIVNVGYDSRLVNRVISDVRAKIKPLLGFPSLQPIMYQGNILNLIKSKSELGIEENEELLYAPANHPFITAHVISEYVKSYVGKNNIDDEVKNIYLSPLATKAQTIGMALFYIFEKEKYKSMDISLHIRYPFTNKYSASSSQGYFRINQYTVEFDLFDNIKNF